MEATFKLADPSDMDVLAEFMREYYEFDHLAFDDLMARAALQKILSDDSLGRVWLIQYGEDTIGYIVLTLGFSLEFRGRDAFIHDNKGHLCRLPYYGAARVLGWSSILALAERKKTGRGHLTAQRRSSWRCTVPPNSVRLSGKTSRPAAALSWQHPANAIESP